MGKTDPELGGRGRILVLDYAKIIGVFLTVFGHLYSSDSVQRVLIYAFHMPLFFMISGILYKKRTFKEELLNTTFRIVLPAFFFIFVFIIISSWTYSSGVWDSVYGGFSYFEVFYLQLKQLYYGLAFSSDVPNLICWFLFTLAICRLFKALFSTNKIYIFIVVSLTPIVFKFIHCCYLTNAYMALPFFYLGYILRSYTVFLQKLKTEHVIIFLICLFVITVPMILYNGRVSMSGVNWGQFGLKSIPFFYINGIFGSFIIILFSEVIHRYRVLGDIHFLSNSFMSILGFQYFFIYTIVSLMGYDNGMITTSILSIIIIVLCSYLQVLFYGRIQHLLELWQKRIVQKYLISPK